MRCAISGGKASTRLFIGHPTASVHAARSLSSFYSRKGLIRRPPTECRKASTPVEGRVESSDTYLRSGRWVSLNLFMFNGLQLRRVRPGSGTADATRIGRHAEDHDHRNRDGAEIHPAGAT